MVKGSYGQVPKTAQKSVIIQFVGDPYPSASSPLCQTKNGSESPSIGDGQRPAFWRFIFGASPKVVHQNRVWRKKSRKYELVSMMRKGKVAGVEGRGCGHVLDHWIILLWTNTPALEYCSRIILCPGLE